MGVTAYSGIVTQLALLCICLLAFSIRLFSVVKYESVIHGAHPRASHRLELTDQMLVQAAAMSQPGLCMH